MTTYAEMVDLINRAKEAYYGSGETIMSDQEYDRLVAKAEKLGYVETVGSAPIDAIEKIKHEHPMLSLAKIHTVNEVKSFLKYDSVAMWKADGLTISATYIDGKLTRLETRGDGSVGNDIMHHAMSIENLPMTINKSGKYVIDGECVILYPDFEKINAKIVDSEKFKNPRNLAAGSLSLLDGAISAKRHLKFFAWDVIEGGEGELFMDLAKAYSLGFDIVDATYLYAGSDIDQIQNAIDMLKRTADDMGFPIDGIVIKYDDLKLRNSLGATGHHPRNAQALKFKDDTYPTKLISVDWQIGKTAQLTPVAIFEPVIISGSEVSKASLHNITIMKQLGITNGCTCYIKKANEIIPQLDSVDDDGDGEIKIPEFCPICSAPTRIVKENKSEVLYCTNDECPGKTLGKWVTFVSKKGMDIDGLSEQTLDKLINFGYLTNMFESVYSLHLYKNELYKIDGFGKKSIDNLLAAIEASKECDLVHFITAFSIPGIGEGQSKLLAKFFKTFDAFSKACDNQYDFSAIPGIGPVLSRNINKWWMLNHMQMIDIAGIVSFIGDDFMNKPEGSYPLVNKIFVITGSVHHYKNRAELQKAIEDLGGKVAGSVNKNTSYLINNDVTSDSSKNKKAKDLGIPIITEEEFLELIK